MWRNFGRFYYAKIISFNCSNWTIILCWTNNVNWINWKIKSNEKKNNNKKLLVIHNLNNLTSIEEIDDFIKNIIKNSLTFKLEEKPYDKFNKKSQPKNENLVYYQEKNDNVDIFHIIMGMIEMKK